MSEHGEEFVLTAIGTGQLLGTGDQGGFEPAPLGDVSEKDGNFPAFRAEHAEGIDIKPTRI
jgi:hypothetical protein